MRAYNTRWREYAGQKRNKNVKAKIDGREEGGGSEMESARTHARSISRNGKDISAGMLQMRINRYSAVQ